MRLTSTAFLLVLAGTHVRAQSTTILLPEAGTKASVALVHPDKTFDSTFHALSVTSAGRHFHFALRHPVVCIPADKEERSKRGLWDTAPGLRLDSSRCFFRGIYGAVPNRHTLLFFIGEPGIGASSLFVLGFLADGTPYRVLERDALDLVLFRPEADSAVIFGRSTLSQVMAGEGGNGSKLPYATTYDPATAYTISPDSPANYSLEESRRYNLENYVWAGPRSREDYAVVFNLPQHPRPLGVPVARLDKILQGRSATHTP